MSDAPRHAPATRPLSLWTVVAFAMCCAGLLSAWLLFDLLTTGAAPWWVCTLVLAVLAAPATCYALSMQRRWAHTTLLTVLGLTVLLALLPWNPRKRFVRTLLAVQPGMTVAQVDALLADYLLGAGAKWQAGGVAGEPSTLDEQGAGTRIYRWNDHDGAYDSDWGMVTFVAGRVSMVEFLPD